MYRQSRVRFIWKMVKIQMTRNAHAPVRETSIGIMEYPMPRMVPTMTSIKPQRK